MNTHFYNIPEELMNIILNNLTYKDIYILNNNIDNILPDRFMKLFENESEYQKSIKLTFPGMYEDIFNLSKIKHYNNYWKRINEILSDNFKYNKYEDIMEHSDVPVTYTTRIQLTMHNYMGIEYVCNDEFNDFYLECMFYNYFDYSIYLNLYNYKINVENYVRLFCAAYDNNYDFFSQFMFLYIFPELKRNAWFDIINIITKDIKMKEAFEHAYIIEEGLPHHVLFIGDEEGNLFKTIYKNVTITENIKAQCISRCIASNLIELKNWIENQ